jgi:hypothetical protein
MEELYRDFGAGTDLRALHDALYGGTVARFAGLAEARRLVALAQGMLEERFAPHHPTETHRHFDEAGLAAAYAEVQRAFANAAEIKAAFRAVWEAVGFDPDATARDRLMLRFQPPHPPGGERAWARSTATVSFHRDTWGTNLYAQVNWWGPVYPLDPGRTFAFFPELFDRPIANSSDGFDIAQVIAKNRGTPEGAGKGEMVPRMLDEIDWASARPVLIAPGEIIAFSSQHAHAGVQNHTDTTRISFETRTLLLEDHLAGRGAPNVDGRAVWTTPGMFRRVADGRLLSEVLGVEPFERFA